jgi:hypothetical protein
MLKTSQPPYVEIRSSALTESEASQRDIAINYQVIRLVLFGFATEAVAFYTGLTCSQVQYRVKMYKLQGARSMFRMGQTDNAKMVMKLAMRVSPKKKAAEKEMYQAIRDSILDAYKKGEISKR